MFLLCSIIAGHSRKILGSRNDHCFLSRKMGRKRRGGGAGDGEWSRSEAWSTSIASSRPRPVILVWFRGVERGVRRGVEGPGDEGNVCRSISAAWGERALSGALPPDIAASKTEKSCISSVVERPFAFIDDESNFRFFVGGLPSLAMALRTTFSVLAKTLSLRHDADWATFCVISPLLSLKSDVK